MPSRLAATLIAVNLVGACSTTKPMGPVITPAITQEILEAHPGRKVIVEVTPPSRPQGAGGEPLLLRRTTDTATFVSTEIEGSYDLLGRRVTGVVPQYQLDNRLVRDVHVNDRFEGALIGLGIGAAVTTILAVSAAANYDDKNGGFIVHSRGGAATLVGVVVGVPLMLTSTLVGAIFGSTTHYRFD